MDCGEGASRSDTPAGARLPLGRLSSYAYTLCLSIGCNVPPAKYGNQVKLASYYPPDMVETLKKLSDITRVPQAVYLREALEDLLKKHEAALLSPPKEIKMNRRSNEPLIPQRRLTMPDVKLSPKSPGQKRVR